MAAIFRRFGVLWVLAAFAAALPALAQDRPFVATLTSPSGGAAHCGATFSYDDLGRQLTYRLTCDGLSGKATMVHMFGTSPSPVDIMAEVRSTPIIGTASLTDAEATALKAGALTIQVQTSTRPQGEVSGRIASK